MTHPDSEIADGEEWHEHATTSTSRDGGCGRHRSKDRNCEETHGGLTGGHRPHNGPAAGAERGAGSSDHCNRSSEDEHRRPTDRGTLDRVYRPASGRIDASTGGRVISAAPAPPVNADNGYDSHRGES